MTSVPGTDSILRLLIEDDELDLLFDENQYMCALLEEMGGATEADADRQLVRTNRGEGWRRVQRFMNGSEVQCYEILRMNQETFKSLCKVLSEKYGLKETHNVFVEESVAMFLETVGQDATVRAIAEHYQHSTDTVKRKLEHVVLSSLLKLASDIVKPTRNEFATASPFLEGKPQYWPYFRNCIGALDGTHIAVRPPCENSEPFRGRKGEPTMNVLAICNFDMRFIYAYVGVPGRAHDTKVLTYCATEEASFPHPPAGKYYLVDSGYPTRTGYLGPHRKTRYHIDQFNRGGPPSNTRELFNRKHSGLRSMIERTFGVWKAKWRVLDRKHPKYKLKKWIKIVTATMALHNFIRDSQHGDTDFSYWEGVESYEQHGDDEEEHVGYIPQGDRLMESVRHCITMEMARGTRLPY